MRGSGGWRRGRLGRGRGTSAVARERGEGGQQACAHTHGSKRGMRRGARERGREMEARRPSLSHPSHSSPPPLSSATHIAQRTTRNTISPLGPSPPLPHTPACSTSSLFLLHCASACPLAPQPPPPLAPSPSPQPPSQHAAPSPLPPAPGPPPAYAPCPREAAEAAHIIASGPGWLSRRQPGPPPCSCPLLFRKHVPPKLPFHAAQRPASVTMLPAPHHERHMQPRGAPSSQNTP